VTDAEVVGHFQSTREAYDDWYDSHPALYRTELAALKKALPRGGLGLEVGVGTGRFAGPLGVRFGLDPSPGMLELAKRRGTEVVQGVGEALPFKPGSFDFVLIVFVLEFVDDLARFLDEAAKALRNGGVLVAGLIDKDSAWGRHFHSSSKARRFFHPPAPRDLIGVLESVGLRFRSAWQALFGPPPDLESEERPRPGFGQGGFIVFRASKEAPDAPAGTRTVDNPDRRT